MNFLTNPITRSFVGFDNLFDEFERLSSYKEQSYPAYNIEKLSDSDYKITLALAGFAEKDINAEVKDGILSIKAAKDNINQNLPLIRNEIIKKTNDYKKGATILMRSDYLNKFHTESQSIAKEKVGDLYFHFPAGSFFQNNPFGKHF